MSQNPHLLHALFVCLSMLEAPLSVLQEVTIFSLVWTMVWTVHSVSSVHKALLHDVSPLGVWTSRASVWPPCCLARPPEAASGSAVRGRTRPATGVHMPVAQRDTHIYTCLHMVAHMTFYSNYICIKAHHPCTLRQVANLPMDEFTALWKEYISAYADCLVKANGDPASSAGKRLVRSV